MTDQTAAITAAPGAGAPDAGLSALHQLVGKLEERTRADASAAIAAAEGRIRADIAALAARAPRHSHLLAWLAGAAIALGLEHGAGLLLRALITHTGG